MTEKEKIPRKVSSISSSGYGFNFEHAVQSFLVVQMFTGGYIPKMGASRIVRIVPQSSRFGRNTDDCEVILRGEESSEDINLLVQIKKTVKLAESDKDFTKTIDDAWRDFTKNEFDRRKDRIMLVAGDLDKNGTGLKRMLLFIQNAYNSSSDFWRDYESKALGRSNAEDVGFKRLIDRLTKANNNETPDKAKIFDFCKIFHIIRSDMHDANFEDGDINIALVHSALSGYRWANGASPFLIWEKVHSYISEQNQYGTVISLDNLPEKLSRVFATDKVVAQEPPFVESDTPIDGQLTALDEPLIDTKHKRELALLCSIGGFDSSNEYDLGIIESIFGEPRQDILKKIQSISNEDTATVSLEDTIWRALSPSDTLARLSDFIYDNHIDIISDSYSKVLGEVDPALGLPVDERHMASLHDKSRLYSKTLRHGLADGVATFSTNQQLFTNCSLGKIDSMGIRLVQSLLVDNRKPEIWASLSDNMEAIAWTAPKEFLTVIESALGIPLEESPFTALARDSSTDWLFGGDYLSGIRRSLLSLAKDSDFFVRSTIALSALANYEGGKSHEQNHALSSIVELILPWHPKTQASIKARYTAVEKILSQNKSFGRYILKQLLPGVTQTTVEDSPPPWAIGMTEDPSNNLITRQEVYEQGSYYCLLYVNNSNSSEELIDVIENIDHLTDDAIDKFTDGFIATVSKLTNEDKREIWSTLLKRSTQLERRRSNTPETKVSRSETLLLLADKIAPQDEIEKYIHLFSNYDHDLISIEDWESGEKKIKEEREQALIRIVNFHDDLGGLHQLVESAKLPHLIGSTLGAITNISIDNDLLPVFIKNDNAYEAFYKAYIYVRSHHKSNNMSSWVDEINFSDWNNEAKVRFILSLPLGESTWDLLRSQDDSIENDYWSRIDSFVSINQSGYSSYALDSLLKANRPLAALECIYWSSFAGANRKDLGDSVDKDQILEVLLQSVTTSEDASEYNRLSHEVGTIFSYLHNNTDFTQTELWRAEWAYLAIFRSNGSTKPKALVQRIADDADFFCELVQMGYRSSNSDIKENINKVPKNVQYNLLKLLSFNDFPIAPGVDQDGVFHKDRFVKWIDNVEVICKQSGHLEVARSIVGGYLVHSPKDSSGLWIDESVLKVLNRDEAVEMRQGYNTGVYNSRGIHSVDTSGSDEEILRDTWKERANQADEKGYTNVAISLRDLADGYEHHRKRVVRRGSRNGF